MNQKRFNFGIALDSEQKQIYVFGGYEDEFLNSCEKYSLKDDKWTVLS